MTSNQSLLETNIHALHEGVQVLALLKAEQYTQGYKPAFQSTIGAHFRHILEHYLCFLAQVKTGKFCYDARARDQLLECDSNYARDTLNRIVTQLQNFDHGLFSKKYLIDDQQAIGSLETTLSRELLFLQSHTVHHYAIIGAMTRAFGQRPNEEFGVAIATREHQKSCLKDQPIGETSTCAQ